MTCIPNKRKRGGDDRILHGMNLEFSNYSTIRRCIRAGSHPTATGNHLMSNVSTHTHPTILHTHTHTPRTVDDAPHIKSSGSQTVGRGKYPRAGVNSNRFALLERGEDEE